MPQDDLMPCARIRTFRRLRARKNGYARTNNSVEGWHQVPPTHPTSLFSSHYPSMWSFFDGLRKDIPLHKA